LKIKYDTTVVTGFAKPRLIALTKKKSYRYQRV